MASVAMDPHNQTNYLYLYRSTKSVVTIDNQSGRDIFVAVMDDQNARVMMGSGFNAGAGVTGGQVGASAHWDFAHAVTKIQPMQNGKRSDFSIVGDSATIWVSDDARFPRDPKRTPYASRRVNKGNSLTVRHDVFR